MHKKAYDTNVYTKICPLHTLKNSLRNKLLETFQKFGHSTLGDEKTSLASLAHNTFTCFVYSALK